MIGGGLGRTSTRPRPGAGTATLPRLPPVAPSALCWPRTGELLCRPLSLRTFGVLTRRLSTARNRGISPRTNLDARSCRLRQGWRVVRAAMQLWNDPLVLAAGPAPTSGAVPAPQLCQPEGSLLRPGAGLPPNLHLVTLTRWGPSTMLVRLAHTFGPNEDPQLAAPASVDLAALLGARVRAAREVSSSANAGKADMPPPFDWRVRGEELASPSSGHVPTLRWVRGSPVVTLAPMGLGTYLVDM